MFFFPLHSLHPSRKLTNMPPVRRRAFTLLEIIIVIGIISMLMALLLAATERARHKAYIAACGSNLRQLGQALAIYTNENHGWYPRTIYVPGTVPVAGTGTASTDPFTPGGPSANDMTAPIWLLTRIEKLPTKILLCPYGDVNEFTPDPAIPTKQANFTDYHKSLGYSYANPYPDTTAVAAGYRLTSKIRADFALMADLNPGVNLPHKSDVFAPTPTSITSEMRKANSENHEREGQNVLYADGHVTYQFTCFCGVNQDNIYTPQTGNILLTSPVNKDDSLLLPLD